MDNPLTPKKIQRLMKLAEDKSFNSLMYSSANNSRRPQASVHPVPDQSSTNYESSSGLLDLDNCEGFGESAIDNMSLSKSTAFNPGEMTGRSTGTEEGSGLLGPPSYSYGRYSVNIDSLASKMNQQSCEVNEIIRQSITSTYSFHSHRDLTADEASLVMREAPMPVPQDQMCMTLRDSTILDPVEMSMGTYFQNRCMDFNNILPRTDSPKYDASVSGISVDSVSFTSEQAPKTVGRTYTVDQSLDCVPVRQPRNVSTPYTPASPMFVRPADPKPVNKTALKPILFTDQPNKSFKKPMDPVKGVMKQNITVEQFNKSAVKPTILMDPSKQHLYSSVVPMSAESSVDNESLSLSKIDNLISNDSGVLCVSDLLKKINHKDTPKQPLQEIDMNCDVTRNITQSVHVTSLKDTRKTDTASSASSMNTVIDMSKMTISNQENVPKAIQIPTVVVSRHSVDSNVNVQEVEGNVELATTNKSPSNKSRSTLSTVQENLGSASFKSTDSPMQSKGESKRSNVPSPNVEYKELDKSVDWREILLARGPPEHGLSGVSEAWAEIITQPVEGFVGVNKPVTITIKSLSDSWLTAKFQFTKLTFKSTDLTIDLPRFPILLTPHKSEQFTVNITANVEVNTSLPFTLCLKDSCVDQDLEVKGQLDVVVKMPTLQAISYRGVNKLVFPTVGEGKSLIKSFVLISDCPADLQLDLSIAGGSTVYAINSVHEIKKSDVTKKLLEQSFDEKAKKGKGSNRQPCRLSNGNSIRVYITFTAPKLADLNLCEKLCTFTGLLHVNLIGINAVLLKVELSAAVGVAELELPGDTIVVGKEATSIPITNVGAVRGTWRVSRDERTRQLFKISSEEVDLEPAATTHLQLCCSAPEDQLVQGTLTFEDISSITANTKTVQLISGQNVRKTFPIKTSNNKVSWVRSGRKEVSLKNCTDKKIHIKCKIVGEGFTIDLPRYSGQTTFLSFGPLECRPLPVLFNPPSDLPCTAVLHLAHDDETEISRKVFLYGCAGEAALRWSGLVTYGDMAIVRAIYRQDVQLKLVNRSNVPVFLSASVHFNLQQLGAAAGSELAGARRVVAARSSAVLALRVAWARVQRARGPALAALAVLTGAELTRHRILRILLQEGNGTIDVSSLPEHLRRLVGPFEGEDAAPDHLLHDFHETKASLEELVGGVKELSAQIDLSQDSEEEATILIADDTVIDHHTLCD